MNGVWNPERLRMAGSIMQRYAAHIQEGDRVRLGIEGDEMNVYRAVDAPKGTVLSVDRSEEDLVRFRVQLDSGDELELDNRSISPDRVWEVDPDYLDTFKTRLQPYRSTNDSPDVSELVKRIDALETTVATALREMASDLYRASRGKTPEFAKAYADRYDVALADDKVEEEAPDTRHDFEIPSLSFKGTLSRLSSATMSDEE